MANMESRSSSFELKTKCKFEQQLSRIFTKETFKKFQKEVEEMQSCFNIRRVNINGPMLTFVVKERVESEGSEKEIRQFEVLYDYETTQVEVRCICSLFNFKGYLCRHALNVLNYNGVEDIPSQYILARRDKDCKRKIPVYSVLSHVDVIILWNCVIIYMNMSCELFKKGQSEEHYMAVQELEALLNRFFPYR